VPSTRGGFLRDDVTGALVVTDLGGAWTPASNNLKAWSMDPALAPAGTGVAMATGFAVCAKVPWLKTDSITALTFWQDSAPTAGQTGIVAFVATTAGVRLGTVDVSADVGTSGEKNVTLVADSGGLTNVAGGTGTYLIVGVYSGAATGTGRMRSGSITANASLTKAGIYRGFTKALASLPATGIDWTSDTGGAIAANHPTFFGIK
jgi:hypothetical protein